MDEESFLELCRENYGRSLLFTFSSALDFSKKYLAAKKRLSGDSEFDHNLRTAKILMENKTSPEVVLAALLMGLLRHCSEEELKAKFGEEVLLLVKGVDELKRVKSGSQQLEADAMKKILFTVVKDIRVIFIKLAGKLDNLESLSVLPKEEQKHIAEEILDVYAPLAESLGLEKIKVSLEDLSLRILKPQKYQEIVNFLEESREQREKNIAQAIELIKKIAQGKVTIQKIKGRSKHVYSIYKKMVVRKVPLDEQFDLSGIRILVPEIRDCYTLLGLLHENFEPLEGRLKDYIANPKPNFYRSIHSGLKLPGGKIVEVQIRTPEMDEFAEEGLAAHWRYKGIKSDEFFERKISWLKEILDLKKESGAGEFLETVKVDLFGDKIYCYTPKGAVKEMPLGSSVLDFAYLVHEEVGNHAVGGRVNGKFVPLKYQLALGDVVEIITNKNQRPHRGWLKIVKSGKVQQKIRKVLREYETLPAMHFRVLKPLAETESGTLAESIDFPAAMCILAKCCSALPGEPIVGIVTKRRVVSVHRNDCRLALKEEKRWVAVNWKNSFNQKISFQVLAGERNGLLADLLNTIAAAGFEIKEAKAKMEDSNNVQCSFMVMPRDLEHLKELIRRVRKVKGTKRIYFG